MQNDVMANVKQFNLERLKKALEVQEQYRDILNKPSYERTPTEKEYIKLISRSCYSLFQDCIRTGVGREARELLSNIK